MATVSDLAVCIASWGVPVSILFLLGMFGDRHAAASGGDQTESQPHRPESRREISPMFREARAE